MMCSLQDKHRVKYSKDSDLRLFPPFSVTQKAFPLIHAWTTAIHALPSDLLDTFEGTRQPIHGDAQCARPCLLHAPSLKVVIIVNRPASPLFPEIHRQGKLTLETRLCCGQHIPQCQRRTRSRSRSRRRI